MNITERFVAAPAKFKLHKTRSVIALDTFHTLSYDIDFDISNPAYLNTITSFSAKPRKLSINGGLKLTDLEKYRLLFNKNNHEILQFTDFLKILPEKKKSHYGKYLFVTVGLILLFIVSAIIG